VLLADQDAPDLIARGAEHRLETGDFGFGGFDGHGHPDVTLALSTRAPHRHRAGARPADPGRYWHIERFVELIVSTWVIVPVTPS
jgi:hypothetical protein